MPGFGGWPGTRSSPKWREVGGVYHVFFGSTGSHAHPRFTSGCGRVMLERVGGGRVLRPAAILRCGGCDCYEMRVAQVDESLPASPRWLAEHPELAHLA